MVLQMQLDSSAFRQINRSATVCPMALKFRGLK